MSPHLIEDMENIPETIKLLPTAMMALGFVVAWLFYIRRPYMPVELARQHQMLYSSCSTSVFRRTVRSDLRPFGEAARLLPVEGRRRQDHRRPGSDGISARVLDVTRNVVRLQTGYLYHYAFAMLVGVAGLITWFMFGLGGQ